jgi:hypothetical protein
VNEAPVFDYSVFGLRVRSEIELPELLPTDGGQAPDVTIRTGEVDPAHDVPGLHEDGTALVFVVANVGRYRILGGTEILVDALPDAAERNVRLFLLGSVFGALLHQRASVPLHANAVEIAGKAVAFMGPSGAGKSTLAAWFHDHSVKVLADDVCAIRFEHGRAHVVPGLPRLRLWDDALKASGRRESEFQRSVEGYDDYKKFDVPLIERDPVGDSLPIGAIYLLERGDRFDIAPLPGVDAVEALFEHTYRGAFVSQARTEQAHWRGCVQLARSVPIYRITRKWGLDLLQTQASLVWDHARAV